MGKISTKKMTKIKDKPSELSEASTQSLRRISKKEKYIQKRSNLMNKFVLLKRQQKEERNRKNREKTAIIGDLKPLKDALPSLNEVLKLSKETAYLKTGIHELGDVIKTGERLNQKKKLKRKKEKFIRQINSYQKLLKDVDFKKNPREAIRYHIKYTYGNAE